jgi:hypothetical protein
VFFVGEWGKLNGNWQGGVLVFYVNENGEKFGNRARIGGLRERKGEES